MSLNQPRVATQEVEDALRDKMAKIALKEKERQTQTQANALGLGYIDLIGFPIGPETISVVPKEEAEKLQAVCFLKTGTQVRLGAVDPTTIEMDALAKTIGQKYHANVELYVISQHSFEAALKLYERLPKILKTTSDVELAQSDVERYRKEIQDIRQLNQHLTEASISDVFTIVLAGAIGSRASDIHIEAEAKDVRIRYRIDGVLVPVAAIPMERWPRVIARIKLLAGLKLNITTVPQDGRISVFLSDDKLDIRVSTLPTAFGESVVMRLLRSSGASISFEELGLRDRAYEQLKREIERPNGMIVVTGPTGSGKTTTLYAVLNRLNTPESKIITLEDPVEYKLAGINQSQVDWSKDYTFAKGLRSILRQDPDIIMVGEIRDLETADTAIQAALTGHLVLSTVHTNDAAGAVPRFLSMGTKPFLLAPALNAVIGQRLVRKICDHCRVADELTPEIAERVKATLAAIPKSSGYAVPADRKISFMHGAGCEQCHGLGYFGRIGIFEILVVDEKAEKVILGGQVSEYQVRELAEEQGMITMAQDGLLKALDGLTTVEEVFRVAQ